MSGNVFANSDASSSAPYPQELNQWNSSIEEPRHSSTVEKSERQKQDQDQRCQSGPSAKNSVIFSEGDSSTNYGADQQRLQISDLHFDKLPTPATSACWKMRFKTEVSSPTRLLRPTYIIVFWPACKFQLCDFQPCRVFGTSVHAAQTVCFLNLEKEHFPYS